MASYSLFETLRGSKIELRVRYSSTAFRTTRRLFFERTATRTRGINDGRIHTLAERTALRTYRGFHSFTRFEMESRFSGYFIGKRKRKTLFTVFTGRYSRSPTRLNRYRNFRNDAIPRVNDDR